MDISERSYGKPERRWTLTANKRRGLEGAPMVLSGPRLDLYERVEVMPVPPQAGAVGPERINEAIDDAVLACEQADGGRSGRSAALRRELEIRLRPDRQRGAIDLSDDLMEDAFRAGMGATGARYVDEWGNANLRAAVQYVLDRQRGAA